MALDNQQIIEARKTLQSARRNLLATHPFYGILLMSVNFGLDEDIQTAATDGKRIDWNPTFLSKLKQSEVEFILMHELLHIVLKHCFRGEDFLDQELFNYACDIVVNSTIMHEHGDDVHSIVVNQFEGSGMHRLPTTHQEGYLFTAEEVYSDLCLALSKGGFSSEDIGQGEGFKKSKSKNENSKNDDSSSKENNGKPNRGNKDSKTGKAQDGKEGDEGDSEGQEAENSPSRTQKGKDKPQTLDSHQKWGELEKEREEAIDSWNEKIKAAAELAKSMAAGSVPICVLRELDKLKNPVIDWREALNAFVQEIVVDYSFNPPDNRFQDSSFLLPSFSEKDIEIKNVVFFVDTSGSMTTETITKCYSEIKGAIDQFDGKLKGYLGFFDSVVHYFKPFDDTTDITKIRPIGGGGTSFSCFFDYLERNFDGPISSIIVLTDGYADFPEEKIANDVPVLWAIVDSEYGCIDKAPWGRTLHIPK